MQKEDSEEEDMKKVTLAEYTIFLLVAQVESEERKPWDKEVSQQVNTW